LLNGLHEELTDSGEEAEDNKQIDLSKPENYFGLCLKNGDSPVYQNFLGLYRSEISCSECQYKSPQYDTFISVSLDLFQKPVEKLLDAFLIYKDFTRNPKKISLKVMPELETLEDIEKRLISQGEIQEESSKELLFAVLEDSIEHIFYNKSILLKETSSYFTNDKKRFVAYEMDKINLTEFLEMQESSVVQRPEDEEAPGSHSQTEEKMIDKSQAPDTQGDKEIAETPTPSINWKDFYSLIPVSFVAKTNVAGCGLIKSSISFTRILILKKTQKLRDLNIEIIKMMEMIYPDFCEQIKAIVESEISKKLEEAKQEKDSDLESKEGKASTASSESNNDLAGGKQSDSASKNVKNRPLTASTSSSSKDGGRNTIASTSSSGTSKRGGQFVTRGGAGKGGRNDNPKSGGNNNSNSKNSKEQFSKENEQEEEKEEEREDILGTYLDNLPYELKMKKPSKKKAACIFCKKSYCDSCKADVKIEGSLGTLEESPVFDGDFQIEVEWANNTPSILNEIVLEKNAHTAGGKDKQAITNLSECVEFSSKAEILADDNRWNCPECKELRVAEKRILLHFTPKYLIFHLKRFKSLGRGKREKNPQLIEYPLDLLDLTNFTQGITPNLLVQGYKQPIYELFGVVCHEGTLENGHYYSFCRTEKNRWSKFDDSKVTETVPEREVSSKHAYILFYRLIKEEIKN
jgi:hypothetical protein